MKQLALLLAFSILLSGCSGLKKDLLNAKNEATDAVNNLAEEAIETKELIENKVDQVQTATESVTEAVDAVNEATSDLKAITGNK